VVTPNSWSTEISSTSISIRAILVCDSNIHTSCNFVTIIGGTQVAVVTIDFGVNTTLTVVTRIGSTCIVIVAADGSVGTANSTIARIVSTCVIVVAIYGRGLTSGLRVAVIVGACIVVLTIDRSINTSSLVVAGFRGAVVVIVTVYWLVGTSRIGVAVINGACIIVVTIDGCFSTTILLIATISVALVWLATQNWSVNTPCLIITSVGGANIVVITVNGSGNAANLDITRIGVTFAISIATVRVIRVNASLVWLASSSLTGIAIITGNICNVYTSNSGAAIIGGAGIVIVTIHSFVLATFLGITRVDGTIVVVIAIDRSLNTSHLINTCDSVASIAGRAYIWGVSATSVFVAGVYDTRISIVTINGSMGASRLRITSIVSTSVVIITAYSRRLATSLDVTTFSVAGTV